jgi:hypothetical protein
MNYHLTECQRNRVNIPRLRSPLNSISLGPQMKVSRLGCHLVVALAFGPLARAQEPARYPTEWKTEASGLFGATVTYPQKFTVDASLLLGPARRVSGYGGQARGALFSAEAGLGGLKLGLGYAHLEPFDAGLSGYAIRAVGLRTWGARWGVEPNSTYLGPEVLYYFSVFRANIGLLRNVAGSSAQDWLVTGGIGLCFLCW